MKATVAIIEEALAAYPAACIAFSGGDDSLTVVDIIHRHLGLRLPLLYCDSLMDYPGTADFVRETAARYNTEAIIATAPHAPTHQWTRYGWAMLGKMAARKWMQRHKQRGMGFRVDKTGCCRKMKIEPARRAMSARGIALQFTGQRGGADDNLRGLRAIKDGAIKYVASDRITVANPITGWTHTMVKRYHEQHHLVRHPAKAAGAQTIGCLYCGGGAQFTNSCFRVLRHTRPDLWRGFVVDQRAGEIILAIKYDQPLPLIQAAVQGLGGLDAIADKRPWVFDFITEHPITDQRETTDWMTSESAEE